MKPLAVIADVHGNIWALDAVLEDIERRGISAMVNLGDHLWGPLDPAATADRLMRLNVPSIRGNQDRTLLEPESEPAHPTAAFTGSTLTGAHWQWLRAQPPVLVHENLFLCHGTPDSDLEYLAESVGAAAVTLRTAEEIAKLLSPVPQSVVLCGHTHIPRVLHAAGKLIVNPGSVGLPAYSDSLPYPHRMEAGSPHARYAVLRGDSCELVAVAYDWERAAQRALSNGRADWAHALRCGRAL